MCNSICSWCLVAAAYNNAYVYIIIIWTYLAGYYLLRSYYRVQKASMKYILYFYDFPRGGGHGGEKFALYAPQLWVVGRYYKRVSPGRWWWEWKSEKKVRKVQWLQQGEMRLIKMNSSRRRLCAVGNQRHLKNKQLE